MPCAATAGPAATSPALTLHPVGSPRVFSAWIQARFDRRPPNQPSRLQRTESTGSRRLSRSAPGRPGRTLGRRKRSLRLEHESWEAADGTRRQRHHVVADSVDFLDRPTGGEADGEDGASEAPGRGRTRANA